MKIAISTNAPQLDAQFNPRFGRCAYFIIVDTDTRQWEAYPNPAANAGGGAGPQAVQFISSHGAQAIVSGGFGPNAYGALQAAGIQMYTTSGGTAASIVDDFVAGKLNIVTQSTNAGHHGGGRW
jgi:predicted Fe-Mo cluster-binding NifX family protein